MDAHKRIVESEIALFLRVVNIADLVADVGVIADHAESVCITDGDKDLLAKRGIQKNAVPLAECGAIRPNVDENIKNFPLHHSDKLGLAGCSLEVHSANGPFFGKGVVVLNKTAVDASLLVKGQAECLAKKAAVIMKNFRANKFDARQGKIFNFHE